MSVSGQDHKSEIRTSALGTALRVTLEFSIDYINRRTLGMLYLALHSSTISIGEL